MSISLTEASKLSTDILLKGIIETIVKDSPILQELPFIQIVGNSLKYNREKTLPTVAWYDPVTDTWTTSEPEFEQCSASLRILGGDADVDNFLKATRSNIQDLEAAVIEQKAKALRNEFENVFLNGDSGVNAKQPDGLYKTMKGTAWVADTATTPGDVVVPTSGKENGFRYEATAVAGDTKTHATTEPTWPTTEGGTVVDDQVTWTCKLGNHLVMGANGATLTLTKIDQLIDLVRGGKPDLLLMSRRSRRKIAALAPWTRSTMERRRKSSPGLCVIRSSSRIWAWPRTRSCLPGLFLTGLTRRGHGTCWSLWAWIRTRRSWVFMRVTVSAAARSGGNGSSVRTFVRGRWRAGLS